MYPTLRLGDGFRKVSLGKRDAVLRLQRALARSGINVDSDGLFGQGTRQAVINFQINFSLENDGVVGPATWEKLKPFIRPGERQFGNRRNQNILDGFSGELAWVHDREGHAGRPYWPGGESGVTLDPGFDLGHQNIQSLQMYYAELSVSQLENLSVTLGLRGGTAKRACRRANVSSIRISKEMALDAMPAIADKYWRRIVQRFPELLKPRVPPCIHTIMLSLAYNRGANNRALNDLVTCLNDENWHGMADIIGNMQQDHPLIGIRKRRQLEADYIRVELEFRNNSENSITNKALMAEE